MGQETLKALQKLKVDCIYKKNTHFNAARRVHSEANRFRIFLIAGTISASFSTIMNIGVWEHINIDTTYIQVVVNLLGALGGFLMLYSTTFSDHNSKIELSAKHEVVGNSVNLLYKKTRIAEAAYVDELLNGEQLIKRLDEFSSEYHSICNSAPLTDDKDFLKAKEYFDKGLSEYTDRELKL
ncbi:hypothetical protein SanaruYs_34970 [Chryseotalea sanaruensis]|uniref:SMODS and SLOG-associating 2TM effector domain-containing protein n=1 Tax=Chryseotalea sanaruensis TaxID=2482724 RepID=A0A401UEH7_9BACT|nr:SLATT domain-containing protein [Chryseotalea sanaruensis]GCC53254.1 hypothetical protein SanaruYs_34970 [Chryseotalea sanaruensis]